MSISEQDYRTSLNWETWSQMYAEDGPYSGITNITEHGNITNITKHETWVNGKEIGVKQGETALWI